MNVDVGKKKTEKPLTLYYEYRGLFLREEWEDGKNQKSYICSLIHSHSMCTLSTMFEIYLGTCKFENEIKMFSIHGAMTKINANIF